MATRWYLGDDSTAKTNAISSGWDNSGSATIVRKETRTSSQTPAIIAKAQISVVETSGTAIRWLAAGNSRGNQYFTKPLSAQTILSGTTFRLQVSALEDNLALNGFLHLKIRHFNSSDVQQGSDYIADGGSEFVLDTSTGRYVSVSLASNLSISAGDYLVFEIGIYCNNTMTGSYGGFIYMGYTSNGDIPADETDTTYYAWNPWIECSQTLTFQGAGNNFIDTVADTEGLTDALSLKHGFGRTSADTEGVTDSTRLTKQMIRSIGDTVGVTDKEYHPSAATEHDRVPGDSLGVSDSLSQTKQMVRAIGDIVGVTDNEYHPGGATEFDRTPGDSLGVSDSTVRKMTYVRRIRVN